MMWCRTYLAAHWLTDTFESLAVAGGIALVLWGARGQAAAEGGPPPRRRGRGLGQAGRGGRAESGADLAGGGGLAAGVVVAGRPRPDPGGSPGGLGVPADDELLGVLALELEPV